MATWLTAADRGSKLLDDVWPDHDGIDATSLDVYLEAAREACVDYGPPLDDPEVIRASWVLAQAMQARSIFNAGSASAGDGDPSGVGYGITTFPLDWQVRQLLRPQQGIGVVA